MSNYYRETPFCLSWILKNARLNKLLPVEYICPNANSPICTNEKFGYQREKERGTSLSFSEFMDLWTNGDLLCFIIIISLFITSCKNMRNKGNDDNKSCIWRSRLIEGRLVLLRETVLDLSSLCWISRGHRRLPPRNRHFHATSAAKQWLFDLSRWNARARKSSQWYVGTRSRIRRKGVSLEEGNGTRRRERLDE